MAKIIPPRRDEPLTAGGLPTIRFAEYLERMSDSTNENSDSIAASANSNNSSLLFTILQRIGSGDALTSDETGFTVDSDRLTVDRTEA